MKSTTSSNVPMARELIKQMLQGKDLSANHKWVLRKALSLMTRKFDGRASTKSVRFTSTVAANIRAYLKVHPDASYQDVATRFRVNIGRVTDAMNKRK